MIDLTKETVLMESLDGQHVWPLRVTATSRVDGLSDAIFVYHASMGDDAYEGDVFEAVASVQQMRDIPEGAPSHDANGEVVPYYRTRSLAFMARSPSEAEELWEYIRDDVEDLVRNWSSVYNLTETDTVDQGIVLKDTMNAGARDLVNVERIGVRTMSPEHALDIDPETPSTLPERGIRLGGDVEIYRSGVNSATIDAHLDVVGSFTVNGQPVSGDGGPRAYTHYQQVADALWHITHNLGFHPNVRAVSDGGNMLIGSVEYLSENQLVLNFNGMAFSGTAWLS